MADFQETEAKLLHWWQTQHFTSQDETKNSSQRASALRNLLFSTTYSSAIDILPEQAASSMYIRLADEYANILDSPVDKGGLDNFAEEALKLSHQHKNDDDVMVKSIDPNDNTEGVRQALIVIFKYIIRWKFSELRERPDCFHPSVIVFTESNEWKSSLTMESTRMLPCVKSLLSSCQESHNQIFKPGWEADMSKFIKKPATISSSANSVPVCNQKSLFNQTSGPTSNASSIQNRIGQDTRQVCGLPNTAGSRSNTEGRIPRAFPDTTGSTSYTEGRIPRAFPDTSGSTSYMEGRVARGVPDTAGSRSTFYGVKDGDRQGTSRQGFKRKTTEADPGRDAYSSAAFKNNSEFSRKPTDVPEDKEPPRRDFRTAREQLAIDNQKKNGKGQVSNSSYGGTKKTLGPRRGGRGFVPPVLTRGEDENEGYGTTRKNNQTSNGEEPVDERLKNIDQKMVELIMSEVMDHGPTITWDDIAGLEFAKNTIKEIVVWPMLRPDIFTGLRGPPKGLLLFGPPGTGKTLIGKCIASQSKSTFFSISASSLTSKWVGEGEKMVRALFAVARCQQPAVIFIDEIDSLLSQRSESEHESSRRIKTEFLVQLDGATTGADERILVVGATNRPHELDEAARRRFVKRLYIPLPEGKARKRIIINLMSEQSHQLSQQELQNITDKTQGYSGADMANLCREAALGPIRSISFQDIQNITADQVRPIIYSDFENAIHQVRASVTESDLDLYLDWNKKFGSWSL